VKGKAVTDDEALQSGPHLLICDEAHMNKRKKKHTNVDITQALKQVKTQHRFH